MGITERLYYEDSHLLEFDARVLSLNERDDGAVAVILDRTAFYPTGGGQPSDTGSLNETRVIDCIDLGDDGALHVIQGLAPEIGDKVHGQVDWPRRLDHIQQHTGQHILSQAFVTLFDAPTHSFRVMDHLCEIDVALADPTNERIEQAVDLANRIIWENRPIAIRQVTPDEAARLPLRKDPVRDGELRLIEIADFDLTPCGGTHARSAGEVGVIAVRSWERAKGLTRIQFAAGGRVLTDYRKANKTARDVAEFFSAGRDDTPELVSKLIEDNKKQARRIRKLEQIAATVEAAELIETATILPHGCRLISKTFDDRDGESLKLLAAKLAAQPNVIVLLASRDGDNARLVFARSSDAPGDMNTLMREACAILDGRGGGKPDLAQGGGRNVAKLPDAIAAACQSCTS
jgi:alanyl-tRNA synthetase